MRKLSVILVLIFSMVFLNIPTEAASSSQLIIINKKTNTLAFYNAGKFVRTFSVATGKSRDLTPEGKFQIVNKIVNRPYYSGHIAGGDPRNPLGNRWMGLNARGTYGTTYGIHGNNDESSIGKYISHGCVRMHNAEVRWLYDQVQLYTTVIITYSSSSFDAIAKANGYNVGHSNGWALLNGTWYYFVNGKAATGWIFYQSHWYYLDNSGAMKTGWAYYKNHWYYLDNSGAMKTGWALVKGKWYYLDQSGAMKTGWLTLSGKTYYLSASGARVTGWLQTGGKWYYFNNDGSMAVNTTVQGYKVGADGAWVQVDYVALGDSLAAGMTPAGLVDSKNSYPYFIDQDLAKSYQVLNFVNFGVPGYKTDDVITDLGKANVQAEIKKATHVTIDIGANDLLPVVQADPAQAPAAIQTIAGKIDTILANIAQLNPNVKVYVMGYYNPFPYVTDATQKAQLDTLLQGFNAQIQNDALKHGDSFVPTAQVINVADFQKYIPSPTNIHLSPAGYQVVAAEFWKAMNK